MDFKYELKRVASPIIVGLIAVCIAFLASISRANFEVVVFKFLIFCPALTLVHVSRKLMFPYIDLGKLIRGPARNTPGGAATIAGVFLYYVILTYALTQAI
jgi:GTPase involved in cell partitioning and DNA repair